MPDDRKITRIDLVIDVAIFIAAVLLLWIIPSYAYSTPHQVATHCHRIVYKGHHPPRRLCKALSQQQPASWAYDRHLIELLHHESSWQFDALNSSSGACSWFQFLPCRCNKSEAKQASCGYTYIKARYRTPARALRFWRGHGWY